MNGDIDGVEALDHRDVLPDTRQDGRTLGFSVESPAGFQGCRALYPFRDTMEAGQSEDHSQYIPEKAIKTNTHIFLNDIE